MPLVQAILGFCAVCAVGLAVGMIAADLYALWERHRE